MLQLPEIDKEDFIKTFKFLRLPLGWAGESFTKVRLLVYFVMRNKETKNYRIYEVTYKIPLTYKFLKKNWKGIDLKKDNSLEIVNEKELSRAIVDWDDENKITKSKIKYELGDDFMDMADIFLKIEKEAKERGWRRV